MCRRCNQRTNGRRGVCNVDLELINQRHQMWWNQCVCGTHSPDKPAVEQAIKTLYSCYSTTVPSIHWFGGPKELFARLYESGDERSLRVVSCSNKDKNSALAGLIRRRLPRGLPNAELRPLLDQAIRAAHPKIGEWHSPAWSWLLSHYFAMYFEFESEVGQESRKEYEALFTIGANASMIVTCEEDCFLVVKPDLISIDNNLRLGSTSGPAMRFSDGFELYSISGVAVDRRLVEEPDFITVQTIDNETNIEVRRVMLDVFGLDRYFDEGNTNLLQQDQYGALYEKVFRRRELSEVSLRSFSGTLAEEVLQQLELIAGEEPLRMLRVMNSTPEPDGSFRYYVLRVPPNMETAKQAVAWTFGLSEDEYDPTYES